MRYEIQKANGQGEIVEADSPEEALDRYTIANHFRVRRRVRYRLAPEGQRKGRWSAWFVTPTLDEARQRLAGWLPNPRAITISADGDRDLYESLMDLFLADDPPDEVEVGDGYIEMPLSSGPALYDLAVEHDRPDAAEMIALAFELPRQNPDEHGDYTEDEIVGFQETIRDLPADLGELDDDELLHAMRAADVLEEMLIEQYGAGSAQGMTDRYQMLRSELHHRMRAKGMKPRRNPALKPSDKEIESAVNVFEGFHAYEQKRSGVLDIEIPSSVRYGGPCTWVTYRSDKWGDKNSDGSTPEYIHEITSYPNVFCGLIGGGGGRRRKVPKKIQRIQVVAQLGLAALGAAFVEDGDEVEMKFPRGTRWYWSARARVLLAVQSKRKLLAMVWGGKLDVEPRGIVG